MPNFKSDIITTRESANYSDKTAIQGDRIGAVILYATAIYTLLGTEAAADTIQILDLPAGASVVPQLSHVTCADPGTTLTLDIGDASNTDRSADGIVLSAGGLVAFTSGTLPVDATVPTLATEQTRIYATVASADELIADVKVVFTIAYRIKG